MKLNFRCSFCNFTFPLFSLFDDIRKFYCCWSFVLVSWTTHCFLTACHRPEVHRLSSTDPLHSLPLRRLCRAYSSCWQVFVQPALKFMEAPLPPYRGASIPALCYRRGSRKPPGNAEVESSSKVTPLSWACTSCSQCWASAEGAEELLLQVTHLATPSLLAQWSECWYEWFSRSLWKRQWENIERSENLAFCGLDNPSLTIKWVKNIVLILVAFSGSSETRWVRHLILTAPEQADAALPPCGLGRLVTATTAVVVGVIVQQSLWSSDWCKHWFPT